MLIETWARPRSWSITPIAFAKRHPSEIDLVLTDVVLPKIGGRELAEALVRARPGLKVVYMSGYTDDAIVHHGVLEPGTAFIEKPLTPHVLLEKIRFFLS
jgi:FixJ family two-component response regulator